MDLILTVDFGSTFTKLTALDQSESKIVATAKAFTTIETDIREGFENAYGLLKPLTGNVSYAKQLACSSAGGGLKMIAVGLVPDLTAKAARLAANSAGAKVMKTYAYELSAQEQQEIFDADPDIVLLSGGTDGGNKDVILHNAKMLREIDRPFSVIIAGNKSAANAVYDILHPHKHTVLCANVMPVFHELNIQPAKQAIRNLFIEKIIVAKGLSKAQEMMDNQIIPTPLAVLEACELLARGTEKEEGLGQLMAVDIGGATTDVYSMADGKPVRSNVVEKGLAEPFAKRTVEGDLGLRYSMSALVEAAGLERVAAQLQIEPQVITQWLAICKENPSTLPQSQTIEKAIDEELAAQAVEIAFSRHCGYLESVYTPFGETFLQTGKDLSEIPYVIGIGGPVINSEAPEKILQRAVAKDFLCLRPTNPKFLLDKQYIFAAAGLLGREAPELAVRLMKQEL